MYIPCTPFSRDVSREEGHFGGPQSSPVGGRRPHHQELHPAFFLSVGPPPLHPRPSSIMTKKNYPMIALFLLQIVPALLGVCVCTVAPNVQCFFGEGFDALVPKRLMMPLPPPFRSLAARNPHALTHVSPPPSPPPPPTGRRGSAARKPFVHSRFLHSLPLRRSICSFVKSLTKRKPTNKTMASTRLVRPPRLLGFGGRPYNFFERDALPENLSTVLVRPAPLPPPLPHSSLPTHPPPQPHTNRKGNTPRCSW